MMFESEDLYAMKLHETLVPKDGMNRSRGFVITRVPSGWIYEMQDGDNYRPVFVPFDNFFMGKEDS